MIRWTDKEDGLLIANYSEVSKDRLLELLSGRTMEAIWYRAKSLKIRRYKQWSKNEDNILKQNYPDLSYKQLDKLLPKRSIGAIRARLGTLDIRRRIIPDQNGKRLCYECDIFLPVDKFRNRITGGKQHRLNYCIECTRTRGREREQALRLIALQTYSAVKPFCDCCGEDTLEFLAIDHVNNNGAEHRKEMGNIKIHQWLKKHNYPEGFQILCHNCNLAKGFYGKCPHEN